MAQEEIYYRPPSEADSFIIRVMRGCPHNKCTFCDMYKKIACEALPLDEVLAGLNRDAAELGERLVHKVGSMYLEGGDPLYLPAEDLLAIMRHAKSLFPALRRFACYATARFTIKKTQEDLNALAQEGLQRVFIGLESGSGEILRRVKKDCTCDDLALAGEMLGKAGIEMDVSMMLGIGGRELSREHALQSAALLDRIAPVCVRIRTFSPKDGTELYDDITAGRFEMTSAHETLRELRLLVENIHSPMQLLSEHWTNFARFNAQMPGAKPALLAYIDEHLQKPEESFRKVGATCING